MLLRLRLGLLFPLGRLFGMGNAILAMAAEMVFSLHRESDETKGERAGTA